MFGADAIAHWPALIPPLLTIIIALIFKEVTLALVVGVLSGAVLITGPDLSTFSLFLDNFLVGAVADKDHVYIILFSMLIGGMVSIISANGGMESIVRAFSRKVKNARDAQMATFLMGIAIFFDDYANSLIVGNTMRPLTDRYGVSREKLAYLVDSTAAPVVSIAFVTTWIGAELGYIQEATTMMGIKQSAYSIFLNSLQYAFYPIFALAFMLMLILTGKDFGPMRTAEENSKAKNIKVKFEEVDEGPSKSPLLAIIPVLTLIGVTAFGLYWTGTKDPIETEGGFLFQISTILGQANSYKALLWGAFSCCSVAILLTISLGKQSLHNTMEHMLTGFKQMMPAMVILTLAWALSGVIKELKTAEYLGNTFQSFSPIFTPALIFILAGIVAFSTGSSWGTMSILYPLVLPLVWTLAQNNGYAPEEVMPIIYHCTSAILAGSVFGDHCSPISDTTILSSMASDCNHLEHVRTQAPYALTVALVSIVISIVPVNLGMHWSLNFILGFLLLWAVVWSLGKKFLKKPSFI